MYQIYILLEVRGPSGPQLVVGGPSGRLDFVLRALRPRLTHQMHLTHQARQILFRTDEPTNKAILGVTLYVLLLTMSNSSLTPLSI